MTKQRRHIRTSKKGKKFVAGKIKLRRKLQPIMLGEVPSHFKKIETSIGRLLITNSETYRNVRISIPELKGEIKITNDVYFYGYTPRLPEYYSLNFEKLGKPDVKRTIIHIFASALPYPGKMKIVNFPTEKKVIIKINHLRKRILITPKGMQAWNY